MEDKDILSSMKTMLQPIQNQLEDMDLKLDTMDLKIETLQLNQKTSERAIKKDINYLNDEVDTLIAVLEAKDILKKIA